MAGGTRDRCVRWEKKGFDMVNDYLMGLATKGGDMGVKIKSI